MFYRPVAIGTVTLKGNLFLAPVAGYSDRAFRYVCRAAGADFSFTEMVSSEALVRGSAKTELLTARAENEDSYAVQLFGASDGTMARAAEIVYGKASPSVIDINAGCPVPKITRTGAGAALTGNPERLYAVVRAVALSVPVPVTVKIRSGWDAAALTWKEALCAAIDAGAAAVTVHPRTRAQGYEGKADWGILAEAVKLAASYSGAKTPVPVFGSGDVFLPEDAVRMLRETGVAGVMFARGAMGNPFVFEETKSLLLTGRYEPTDGARRIRAGLRELELLTADIGEYSACREMRKRFCAYTKGQSGGAALRNAVVAAETAEDYRRIFHDFIVNRS
jgi:nifR3 family TIM-barrel protein